MCISRLAVRTKQSCRVTPSANKLPPSTDRFNEAFDPLLVNTTNLQ